jgi:hypothetical protein
MAHLEPSAGAGGPVGASKGVEAFRGLPAPQLAPWGWLSALPSLRFSPPQVGLTQERKHANARRLSPLSCHAFPILSHPSSPSPLVCPQASQSHSFFSLVLGVLLPCVFPFTVLFIEVCVLEILEDKPASPTFPRTSVNDSHSFDQEKSGVRKTASSVNLLRDANTYASQFQPAP